MNTKKNNPPALIFCGVFFILGAILFIGSFVGYFFSQGMPGEMSPDYMGGTIITNVLSAYFTVMFWISLIFFGVGNWFMEKL